MVLDVIDKNTSFYIYGAQVVAYGAYTAIKHLRGKVPKCFLVSNLDGNPAQIESISVKTPNGVRKDSLILVCVTELLQTEIVTTLTESEFNNLFVLTQHEEHLLMSKYFSSIGKFPVVDILGIGTNSDFVMYEVCNHRDKSLKHPPRHREFERTVQAGAALTKKRIAVFSDNSGDNISRKNKQYCEMSAVYWLWKNSHHDWIGIEHYRRHLLVEPGMLNDDVDAILPLPYICYPNEVTQFGRFVGTSVITALKRTLHDLHPNEYNTYMYILYGQYQYTYNLLCAKRAVFNDYCRWFFHITEYMEKLSPSVPEIAETRALSYVAEVLTNIYFMSNADKLRLRHAEKAIYT